MKTEDSLLCFVLLFFSFTPPETPIFAYTVLGMHYYPGGRAHAPRIYKGSHMLSPPFLDMVRVVETWWVRGNRSQPAAIRYPGKNLLFPPPPFPEKGKGGFFLFLLCCNPRPVGRYPSHRQKTNTRGGREGKRRLLFFSPPSDITGEETTTTIWL